MALLWISPAAEAGKRKVPSPADLTNFMLSPEYSQWLVGPIFHIASAKEVAEYLSLVQDGDAQRFIEEFWRRRGPEPVWPAKGKRQLFEERVAEADRLFTEGTISGRRTDRGVVYVLYGPPAETRYDLSAGARKLAVESWSYPKGSPEGLDDKEPDRLYRFVTRGDLTVLYRGRIQRGNPSFLRSGPPN
jgi:GWxTD domain-containing protein